MLKILSCLILIISLAACQSQPTTVVEATPGSSGNDPQATAAEATPGSGGTDQQATINLISVLTGRYDLARTGANLEEQILNHSNVNPDQFGKLFSREVVGDIYAQPLYVPKVEIEGKGTHNVVYVATMHNMVYAFDADDPALADPLWETDLGTPFTQNIFADIAGGEDGILSTPVIDAETGTIYLVSRNAKKNQAVYKLHALDIASGQAKFGSPVDVKLTVNGKGAGNINGTLSLDASNQLQRTGLLLLNGKIYFAFGGNNDQGIWHGWLAAYDASDLQLSGVFNVTPDTWSGGIWMSGAGISSDGTYLYLVAANGEYTVNAGGKDYAQTVLKLLDADNKFTVVDYFTPSNYKELDLADSGLGSTGAILFPNTDLLVTGGKDGNLYVVNKNQMGRFDAETSQNIQTFSAGDGLMYCNPVAWGNGPGNVATIYVWNNQDFIKAYSLNTTVQKFNSAPSSTSALQAVGMPVGSLTLSARGTDAETGILWAIYAPSAETGNTDGVLAALDATDLNKVLWHSAMKRDRDAFGKLAKFNSVTVANGKVYVGSFSNSLSVYGLLGQPAS